MSDELLVTGGTIRTFDPEKPFVAAVGVRGDRIAAVGDLAEVRSEMSARADVVDLRGGLLTPGFRDAHVHPLYGGLDLLSCNLADDPPDADAYLAHLGDYARAHPDAPWIVGGGWSLEAFAGGNPTAAQLDLVVPDRPCYLTNTDRHGAWVNTAALRLAGLDADTPDPPDGHLTRDVEGRPTGMLHEGAAGLVGRLLPDPTADHLDRALLAAQHHLFALGITGWQDAIVGEYLGYPDVFEVYRRLDHHGTLRADVTGALWWDRQRGPDQLDDLVHRRATAGTGRRFRATTVKIMVDGILENGTAALRTPYTAVHAHGTAFLPPAALAAAVAALDRAGFSVHLHVIGDAAARSALDALARLPDPARNRHQLAHLQLIDPVDVPRFAALGVVANAQFLWACESPQMTELTLPVLGPERYRRQYPFGSLAESGAWLAAGSDWPVSTAHPFRQISVAVTRTDPDRPTAPPFRPAERLTVDRAIEAFTVGSAFADHRDDRGVIRVGAVADLSAFDTDPYRSEPAALATISASHTIVRGDIVHAAW